MTTENNLTTRTFEPALVKSIAIGAGIALVLIILFLVTAGEPDPEWPAFWRIKPLVIVPLAGAFGGIFFHLMGKIRKQGGWQTITGYIICAVVYLVALWMGTVLGLNGTYWN